MGGTIIPQKFILYCGNNHHHETKVMFNIYQMKYGRKIQKMTLVLFPLLIMPSILLVEENGYFVGGKNNCRAIRTVNSYLLNSLTFG